MKTVYIIRYDIGRKQSLGIHVVKNEHEDVVYQGQVLELGRLNNKRNISCVPAGKYELRLGVVSEVQREILGSLWHTQQKRM